MSRRPLHSDRDRRDKRTPPPPLTSCTILCSDDKCSGRRGKRGHRGRTGPTGSAGPAGATGATGSNGLGTPGPTGPTGPTGLLGRQGDPGVAGPTGSTGSQGLPGLNGSIGPTGQRGGLQGATGPTGSPGSAGLLGPTGSTGLGGSIGPTGQRGLVGLQGATGSTGTGGPTGSIGLQGSVGPTGSTGSSGIVGVTGPTGSIGLIGSGSIIGYSSGPPVPIAVLVGGAITTGALIASGFSAQSVPIVLGVINLDLASGDTAYVIPTPSTLTKMSTHFSLIIGLAITALSPVSVFAQIYVNLNGSGDNNFTALPSTLVTVGSFPAGPLITGNPPPISNNVTFGSPVSFSTGDRILFVFTASSESLLLNFTGFASGGLFL